MANNNKIREFMDEHEVSRRDLWKALGVGGLAALSTSGSSSAAAQSLNDEPIAKLGDDWEIDVDGSTMQFRHVPTDTVWVLNEDGTTENFSSSGGGGGGTDGVSKRTARRYAILGAP